MSNLLAAAAMAIVVAAAGTAFAGASSAARAEDSDIVSPEPASPRAGGGVAILASGAEAGAVVVGVVSAPRKIDLHGWVASLSVDRVLDGDAELGDKLEVAWEELSTRRAVRFDDEERILVVLDPLPTQSLWRRRFPDAGRNRRVLVVAARGDAFLRRPDGATLDHLEHYLKMMPAAREGAPGSARLAALVAVGEARVAREALELLAARSNLSGLLGVDGSSWLVKAARSDEREVALRAAALRLAADNDLDGTREAALELIRPGSPIRAPAYRALAATAGGLSPAEVDELLGGPDPELRAVAIELGGRSTARPRLVGLARADPSVSVRLAAGKALVDRYGADAIADVIGLLDDPDDAARATMAGHIGELGSPAVEPLRGVVSDGSERAALAAIYGLSRAGQEGGVALLFIATSHQNETVRAFADLALGKAPGHEH